MRLLAITALLLSMNLYAAEGVITYKSSKNFKETSTIIETFIKEKGLTLFAVVNHSDNARQAGLRLNPTSLFIFGNPKVGTPLMNAQISMGLDLPVKLLVHEDDDQNVYVSYNSPEGLAKRHGVDQANLSLKKMGKVLGVIRKKIE